MALALLGHGLTVGGGGTSATPARNTTGAKLIVLAVSYNSAIGAPPTDSAGNTWIQGPDARSGSGNLIALYYCINPITSATHTFTIAVNVSSIAVSYWSGAAPQKDKQNANATGSGGTMATGSITPQSAGELLIAVCSGGGGAGTGATAIDNGFTILQAAANNGNAFGLAHAYLFQAIAAPINPIWTGTGGLAAAILSFVDAVELAATPSFTVSAAGTLSGTTTLAGAATIRFAAAGNMAQGLNAAATIPFTTAANLKPGALRLATTFGIQIQSSGRLGNPAAVLAAAASIHFSTRSKIPSAHFGEVSITLDGVDVRARVNAVTVRDILNDAPNTCTITIAPSTLPAGYGYAAAILADTPIGYWKLDDAAGGLYANDATGHNYRAEASGGITFGQPGRTGAGTAVAIDGIRGTGLTITGAQPPIPARFTLEAWFFMAGQSVEQFAYLYGSGNVATFPQEFAIQQYSSVDHRLAYFCNFVGLTTGWITVAQITLNRWYHAAYTFDGTLYRVYLDGVQIYETNAYAGKHFLNEGTTAGTRSIGWQGPGNYQAMPGRLDDVALYDKALTAAQIAAHHTAAFALPSPPRVNQRLRVVVENNDTNGLLFAGTLQAVTTSYEGRPSQLVYPCQAIDDTAQFNERRPYGSWLNTSATTIALDLVAAFAPAFDTSRIAPGLPLATITFDGSETMIGALARLAGMIGGYTKVEDMAVYLFLTDEADPPDPIDSDHCFMATPPIAITDDVSQQRTRVYGRGHGESLLGDVNPGDTILPIQDVVMFNPTGGLAVASTTPDGAVSERFTYGGVDLGGAGSLAGPGVQPSTAPTVTAAIGAGLGNGTYRYAIVDVTAAGQTLPSPLSAPITTGPLPSPGGSIAVINGGTFGVSDERGGWDVGDVVEWFYAYGDAQSFNAPYLAGAESGHVTITAVANPNGYWYVSPSHPSPSNMVLTMRYSSDPRVDRIYVYIKIQSEGVWYVYWNSGNWIRNYPAQGGQLFSQEFWTIRNYSMSGSGLPTNPTRNQLVLADIALGAGATTARDIYRTTVNGSALKFLQRIANNTSTGPITDATPDASLGAAPPASDTSGLTTTTGQINAGSTSILTASAAPFAATGGWLQAPGNPPIRYTGKTGNTITGIPSSGSGSIVTTIQYGDPIVAAPALIGVAGLVKPCLTGARVCLFVQRDDLAAQGQYGIIEYLIVDERRAEASLIQLCDADLQRFARPLVTVAYATRDPKTKSGKSVVFDLPSPPIVDTLTIQDVTITEINVARGALPRYTVSASSVRFSLEDILRQLAAAAEAH